WQPALAPEHSLSRLPRAEAAWLAKHSLELAVIRPEQIIKRLFRAMSGLVEHEPGSSVVAPSTWGPDRDGGTSTGGSDGVYNDSSSFGSDASASDGGGDSFG
ncbi:MAG TPA: hypothetical protein VHM19_03615, partial [Polyangiales bacterium]|nr:hypothetical protein [Polyangiales bacterium]